MMYEYLCNGLRGCWEGISLSDVHASVRGGKDGGVFAMPHRERGKQEKSLSLELQRPMGHTENGDVGHPKKVNNVLRHRFLSPLQGRWCFSST